MLKLDDRGYVCPHYTLGPPIIYSTLYIHLSNSYFCECGRILNDSDVTELILAFGNTLVTRSIGSYSKDFKIIYVK